MVEIVAFDMEELETAMDQTGVDNLLQVSNAAVHSGSGFSSEAILVNRSGDSVFWQELYSGVNGLVKSEIKECEVEYTPDGRPYFEPDGTHSSRRYVENFIRNNYGRSVK